MFIELNSVKQGAVLVNTDNVAFFINSAPGAATVCWNDGEITAVTQSYPEICAVIKSVMKAKYRRCQCTRDS